MDIAYTTHTLIEQAKAHPEWLLSVVFISGFISGLPVIGALFPIGLLQIGLSSSAARMNINPMHLLSVLMPALLLGDLIGFLCGYYFNHTIKHWRLFHKYQYWFERSEVFFQKYGGAAIIISRVSGPLRTVTPICAGILKMPYTRFLCFDFAAALLWCITHVGTGYLAANPYLWESIQAIFK